jgi:hypothetical protein
MAIEPLVEGPSWTGRGVWESAGRYPLRVEGAVGSIVGELLPGVITTTRHARMYALHTLAWAEARDRGSDRSDAGELLRRMEAVMAAVHHAHAGHRIRLGGAHGEDRVPLFLDGDRFDVDGASKRGGLSRRGFAGVYQGPCVRIRALTDESFPRPGTRADVGRIRAGLGALVDLAGYSSLTFDELRAAGALCLCQAADAEDGAWLRSVLVEDPGDRPGARRRRITCGLLLDALAERPDRRPTQAFRDRWAFGPPEGDPEAGEREMVAALWRAAALRNFSVAAWRSLWRWLTNQLNVEHMTVIQLGERLADALDPITVGAMIADLPPGMAGEEVLTAELQVLGAEVSSRAMRDLRILALGARRLDELTGPTRKAFVGRDPTDLGPKWVAGILDDARDRSLRDLAPDLVETLVRRAQRVALSKMEMRQGRPYVPTRLRDRDGVLSFRGQEGAGDVALRTDSLADVLAGLGYLRRDEQGTYELDGLGVAFREGNG